MRYAVRDPETGKFSKPERINWNGVSIMTTIDNATQADVTEEVREQVTESSDLPAMLKSDEGTIRATFQKFIDGVVNLSSYARSVDMLEAKMSALEKTIEEANARVLEANTARDQAIAEATEAKASAKMAREAYAVVNAANEALVTNLDLYAAEIDELRQSESILQSKLSEEEYNHRTTTNLLDMAREERNRFREEAGSLRNSLEDEQLKNLEFEETKEKLATTEEALGLCARNVAEARAKVTEVSQALIEREFECRGLIDKVNGLEDDNKRQAETINQLATQIAQASALLTR